MSCHAARRLDLLGYGDSCVHRLDSRVKVLLALVFTACVTSFPKYAVTPLVPFLAFPVVLGVLGGVPAGLVLRMLAAAAPFAVLVGVFNPWLDRHSVSLFGGRSVSAGWLSFASIVLRFVLTMSMLLVLTATTSWPGLLHGLLRLRVPAALVTQLHFLYRYLFVLVDEGDRMGHARALRDPDRRWPRLPVAVRMLSSLLGRAWDRSERIYQCMKVRGFRTDFPSRHRERIRLADAVFLVLASAGCVALRVLPVTEWAGRLFTGAGS